MNKTTIITIMALSLCACSRSPEGKELIYSVVLTSPESQSEMVTKYYAGRVQPGDDISLGFKTPGEIININVQEGDRVRKGQLLARLDDSDYRLGVEAARIQYEQLEKEVERMEKLHEAKSISSNDYEKALSGLKQLAIQLEVNERKLDYTYLYAPEDGYVTDVNFSLSEMVDAGTPVFRLISTSDMEVVVDLPDRTFSNLADIREYSCMTLRTGKTYSLHLEGVDPEMSSDQLHRMTLGFDEMPQGHVQPGSNVTVCVKAVNRADSTFTLPVECIFIDGDDRCVWVLDEDGTVSRRTVGIASDCPEGKAVITSGLGGNEKIVRSGVSSLRDGVKVKVIGSASETNPGGLI